MVEWMKGFFIPIIELVFIGGILLFVGFVVFRAVNKIYSTQWKWFFKYTIFRKKYDTKDLEWIEKAINNGIGYYDAKKMLMIKGVALDRVNEISWIYDKIINAMKGGINNNGQRDARFYSKTQSTETEYPTDFKTY